MAGQALFNREQLKNVKEFDLLRLLTSLEKRKEVVIRRGVERVYLYLL